MVPDTRDRVEVRLGTDVPAADLWAVLADFGGIARWLGGVEAVESTAETRRFRIGGAEFAESLLFRDDHGCVLGYRLDEGPLPVAEYEVTLRVDSRDGGAELVMVARYRPIGIAPDKCRRLLSRAFAASLADLDRHLRDSRRPLPAT